MHSAFQSVAKVRHESRHLRCGDAGRIRPFVQPRSPILAGRPRV